MCGSLSVGGKEATRPGKMLSPASPGASSLSLKSACRPRQMPRSGVPRSITSRSGAVRPRALNVRINCPKWPTPGRIKVSAFRIASGVAARSVSRPCRARARSTDGRLPASYSTREIFIGGFLSGSYQALGAGQNALHLRVARGGKAQGAREGLEERFYLVVRRTPIEQAQVNVRLGGLSESAEEIIEQFGLQAANLTSREFPLADAMR